MFSPEYIALTNITSLDPVENLTGPALLSVACRTSQSKTRLIDNCVLGGTL
jgi:pantothenate synthetase